MSDFSWSANALNVLNHFHEVEFIVFVEGQDDVPFWDIVISHFTTKKFQVKSAGEKSTLKKYLRKRTLESNYLIAMDSDYDQLNGELNNQEVMLTYGYSIENTLITPSVIQDLIATHSRVQKNSIEIDSVKKWIDEFEIIIEALLAADILNRERKITDKQVIPDNAARFYEGSALFPQVHKINTYLVQHGFDIEELSCRERLQHFTVFEILKGHFVFSSVFIFIKNKIDSYREKSIPISTESFYSFCISSFENSFNHNHPHFSYYKDMVSHHLN